MDGHNLYNQGCVDELSNSFQSSPATHNMQCAIVLCVCHADEFLTVKKLCQRIGTFCVLMDAAKTTS
jgi:hypothetical protein